MTAVGVKVKITDRKAYTRDVRQFFGARTAFVKVGIFGAKGAEPIKPRESTARTARAPGAKHKAVQSMTVAELAAIHVFGLGVPIRDFLGPYFDENSERLLIGLQRIIAKMSLGAVKSGRPVTSSMQLQAMRRLGTFMVGEIVVNIKSGTTLKALADSTIKQKTVNGMRGTTPLVDTGQLSSSVTFLASVGRDTATGGVAG